MIFDGNHGQRAPRTLVPEGDQNHARDNAVDSHINNSRPTDLEPQTNNTTKASRSTDTRYNRRINPTPGRYSDFLFPQFTDGCAALRRFSTRAESTQTQTCQQQLSTRNILCSKEASFKLSTQFTANSIEKRQSLNEHVPKQQLSQQTLENN